MEARPGGGYLATVGEERISCDNVVVATGTFGRTPNVPEFASELGPSIQQLHSSQYRRPAQLQPGPVLVVGASHSGQDIAYELAEARPTVLCGPSRGNIPFRPESERAHVLLPVVMFVFKHVLTRRTPMGRKEMQDVRFHGGPDFRIKRTTCDRRGVIRNQARMTGVIDGRPAQRRHRARCDQRGLVHGLQAGLRLDLPADPRRVRLAGGVPRRRRRRPGAVFLRPVVPVRVQLDGVSGISRDADYVARQIAARSAAVNQDRGVTDRPYARSGRCAMGVVEELIRAREAYDRREWLAAYGGLSDAAADVLTPDDFHRLATAAYLLGRRNDCVQALQRAYQFHLDAGDALAAVRCAFWLALVLLTSGETAIGGGWVARSQRLLAEVDGDVVERGYVLIHVMYRHIFAGEFDAASQSRRTDHRLRPPVSRSRPGRDGTLRAKAGCCCTAAAYRKAWHCWTSRWSASPPAKSRPSSPATSTAP